MNYRYFASLFIAMVVMTGCKFKKGDLYCFKTGADSLQYVILDRGKGERISNKTKLLKLRHEHKGNTCLVRYLSDSASLSKQKGLLLSYSEAPNLANDMLTKGYFGTLTSKQHVIYLLVSYDDFEKYFQKKE
jgi:hypothetical protein